MKTPAWDVLGIGNSAVDELIYLDQFPQPDAKMMVRDMQRQGGGLVATAMVAAARQGVKTAFCSLIGADELSTFTLSELQREGVDCSPCVYSPAGIPYHAWILVDTSQHTRTILYKKGVVDPPLDAITETLISRCKILFIDHHAPLAGLAAARLANRLGLPVVADLESDQVPQLEELLGLIDHLVLSVKFARKLTGQDDPVDIVRQLGSPQRACCAVTAGDQGCWYSEHGGPVKHFPAFMVKVVDTTGCGDVFHGVYAAALAQGQSIDQAIELASAAAAIKAGHPGGRVGIPNQLQTRQFINERPTRNNLA